jgi:hypothetical protein
MGHIHLGVLPNRKPWRDVVALLDVGSNVESMAAAAAKAAERSLLAASSDPVFVEAVRLLVSIPIAARSTDFGDALRRLDLAVPANPTFLDVLTGTARSLDALARQRSGRTDFSELSSRALSRALTDCVGASLPGLFAPNPEDVRLTFQKSSRSSGMSFLCQSYFSALVGSSLTYWLDRVLAAHIGEGRCFATVSEKARFDQALELHVSETTRIIKEFASGWVGKTFYRRGSILSEDARDFGHVCLRKVVEELREKRDQDD